MAFGIGAPGQSPEMHAGEVRIRTLAEYREQIRQIARQGLVDIMLMSASTNDVLTIQRAAVREQPRHAGRAGQRHQRHLRRPRRPLRRSEPARPFRTATLDHIQCGHVDCRPGRARAAARTWACTASRSTTAWTTTWPSLEALSPFPRRGRAQGLSPFPRSVRSQRARRDLTPDEMPQFINDSIARTLAGVAAGRAAAVPEDRLSRPAGDGGAGRLRSAPGRRHPGRQRGHDVRRLQADRRGAEVRRPRGAVRPQDQQRREPAGVRRVPAADRRRRRSRPRKPCGPITACSRS